MEVLSAETVEGICRVFDLGEVSETPVAVKGGLQHQMFRLNTTQGAWALKRLSPRALATPNAPAHFARCEATARRAADAGLPAVAARLFPATQSDETSEDDVAAQVLYRGTEGSYLVYEWRDGVTLPPSSVGEDRARLMGSLLGRLHALDIRYPDQSAPAPQALPPERWRELARHGSEQKALWSGDVSKVLPRLLGANTRAMHAGLALQAGWVNGHGDYDQKNVLWRNESQGDDPLILDWEQSGPWHPAQEVMGAALNWAGFPVGMIEWPVFQAFLRGYREVAPLYEDELLMASEGVLGKWLIWLEFNLARTLDESIGPDEQQTADNCALHALGMTLNLLDAAPERERWCHLD